MDSYIPQDQFPAGPFNIPTVEGTDRVGNTFMKNVLEPLLDRTQYVFNRIAGAGTVARNHARALANTNQALSGLPTIDTVVFNSNEVVFLNAQSAPAQNGPWVVGAGAWTRPADFVYQAVPGVTFYIAEGATFGGTSWQLTTHDPIVLGTTALTWVQPAAAALGQALLFASSVVSPGVSQTTLGGFGAASGRLMQLIAQAGQQQTGVNANNPGGDVLLKGGDPGTGGSGAAAKRGNTRVELGPALSGVSASFQCEIGGIEIFGVKQTAAGITQLLSTGQMLIEYTDNLTFTDDDNGSLILSASGITNGCGAFQWVPNIAPLLSQLQSGGTGAANGLAFAITGQTGQQQTAGNNNTNGGDVVATGGAPGTGGGGTAGVRGNVKLQGTSVIFNDAAIALAATLALSSAGASSLAWAIGTTPTFKQTDQTAGSTNGKTTTHQSQNATGTTSTGGDWIATSGTGTTAAGKVKLQTGGVDRLSVQPSLVQLLASQLELVRNAATFGSTTLFDLSLGNVQQVTMTAAITTLTISNMKDGAFYFLIFIQDGTGTNRALTVPSNLKVAGGAFVTTTGANKRDQLICWSDGTNLYEVGRAMNV